MPCHTRAAIAFRCSKAKPTPRSACRGMEAVATWHMQVMVGKKLS